MKKNVFLCVFLISVFLNIPEQLVYRDTATLQFTFTGLSFTVGPLY